jgi:mono/diheme cytochrome c family protein
MRILSLHRAATIAFLGAAVISLVAGAEQAVSGQAGSKTVWDGVFTEAQAARGRTLYAQHCAQCHGAGLQGGEYKSLTGDRFWTDYQETTVDYVLGQMSKNMPHSEDGSLKGTLGASVYADIMAHILSANGFPAGTRELAADAVVGVQIVKKEGPGELPAGSLAHVVGCLAKGEGRNWTVQRGSRPVRILSGGAVDASLPLGDRGFSLMFVLTSLDKFVGHKVSVRATLMGEGGVKGLNVQRVESVSATCQ